MSISFVRSTDWIACGVEVVNPVVASTVSLYHVMLLLFIGKSGHMVTGVSEAGAGAAAPDKFNPLSAVPFNGFVKVYVVTLDESEPLSNACNWPFLYATATVLAVGQLAKIAQVTFRMVF